MKIVQGMMQHGKTTEQAGLICQSDKNHLVIEPQMDITKQIILDAVSRGIENEIIVDDLSRTDKALAVVNIFESSKQNELDRMQENRQERDDVVSIITALRDIDPLKSPLINETTQLAVEAMQMQKGFAPLSWLPQLAMPYTPHFEHVLDNCGDWETKKRLESWQWFKGQQLRNELGPYKRIVEDIFSDASVIARCGETDAFDIFEKYRIVCVCNAKGRGGDFLMFWWLYKAIQFIERGV